nr:L-type lectin-domain containing receptor kinase IV.1-like [Coffea arabica]
MSLKPVTAAVAYFLVHIAVAAAASDDVGFIYQGFQSSNLSLDGLATVTKNGLLRVTNSTILQTGYAFYPNPINFKTTPNSSAFSFSTQFVFAIVPDVPGVTGTGMAFAIAPRRKLAQVPSYPLLGLFDTNTNGNQTNHVFAVELDIYQDQDIEDINDNHVGIDIYSVISKASAPASYQANNKSSFDNLTLISGQPMQLWVEYDGVERRIDVTLAPMEAAKPHTPLLSLKYDLSPILQQTMYVGFSALIIYGESGSLQKCWKNGSLLMDLTGSSIRIYTLPPRGSEKKSCWDLGEGGFGRVYKGILTTNKVEVAVKKVSHQGRQGMREFVAEIISIGRLRNRNLVPFLGYCRRKGELLLVYEFMPNGSLDKFLYNQPKYILSWSQRLRVIKGVASGLFYLHEEWEKVVIHRDVKASNVLLDAELNGRLGDFGLARLYDHGTLPQSTHVAGSFGPCP